MCPVAVEYPEPEDDDPGSDTTVDSLEELEKEMEEEDSDEDI